jgi:hypothetical protein
VLQREKRADLLDHIQQQQRCKKVVYDAVPTGKQAVVVGPLGILRSAVVEVMNEVQPAIQGKGDKEA